MYFFSQSTIYVFPPIDDILFFSLLIYRAICRGDFQFFVTPRLKNSHCFGIILVKLDQSLFSFCIIAFYFRNLIHIYTACIFYRIACKILLLQCFLDVRRILNFNLFFILHSMYKIYRQYIGIQKGYRVRFRLWMEIAVCENKLVICI